MSSTPNKQGPTSFGVPYIMIQTPCIILFSLIQFLWQVALSSIRASLHCTPYQPLYNAVSIVFSIGCSIFSSGNTPKPGPRAEILNPES